MNYKKLMGYGDTKKVTKKVSKLKVNKVLENIKAEFGLVKEVGAAVEYRKYYKDIEKKENELAKSVNIFRKVLDKKGIKNDLAHVYLKHTRMWDTYFKKLINKLM